MEDDRPMDARRLRFYAALAVFALWVAALGWLAVRSGRKPPPRAAASEAAGRARPTLARSPIGDALVLDANPTR